MTQKHIDLLNAAVAGNIQPEFVELVDNILHELSHGFVGEIVNVEILNYEAKVVSIDTITGSDGPSYHYSIDHDIFKADNPVKETHLTNLRRQINAVLYNIEYLERELNDIPKRIVAKRTQFENLKERIIEATLEDWQ